jgi:hypothetical protein
MKHLKRQNFYQSSNLTFFPENGAGYSFNWYRIVDRIKGNVILNTYRYSATTGRHIWKIRKLLNDLGIRIDLEIEAPKGLQDLNAAIEFYIENNDRLQKEINQKGTKKAVNEKRQTKISENLDKINFIKNLMV